MSDRSQVAGGNHGSLYLIGSVTLAIVLPLLGKFLCDFFFFESVWKWLTAHSLVEALGAFSALAVGALLLLIGSQAYGESSERYIWIGSGLYAMGILDGFHACVEPGNEFVWLHSVALLLGGLLCALSWLPQTVSSQTSAARKAPGVSLALAVGLGVVSVLYPDSVPTLLQDGQFTALANAINISAGMFFFLAAVKLGKRALTGSDRLEPLLVYFLVLNGASGVIFPFSQVWSPDWWLWHFLRAVAFLVLCGVGFLTMRSMVIELRRALADREKSTETLRGILLATVEGATVIGSAASEISVTAMQVTQGAASTATAVGQTSTTAHEVAQTAEFCAQRARAVQSRAQSAREVSEVGDLAVAETLRGMNEIQDQMRLIEACVNQLSEQGQAIGEVIGTVDGLAEQSNLLAVNASIEAARAGKQGKAFGVVAQEVKSLSDQSRQATKQVERILTEVQRATNRAVAATKQGANAVASGIRQANHAGKSISVLSGSVDEATRSAVQIAASSEQQRLAMNQIVAAISDIENATVQNVASTEKLTESAQSLKELGERLRVMVKEHGIEA